MIRNQTSTIVHCLLLLFPAIAVICSAPAQSFDRRHMVYFPGWAVHSRNHHVRDLPAGSLSHIIYAFTEIDANDRIAVIDSFAAPDEIAGDARATGNHGSFHELRKLKSAHPHLKSVIAVGGWSHSQNFAHVAADPDRSASFANSMVAFLRRHDFDGVDIDWEFPGGSGKPGNASTADDRTNLTSLMRILRDSLDAAGSVDGRDYSLSYATIAGPDKVPHVDWAALGKLCDWVALFGYDYHGSWEKRSNHQSPIHHNPASPDDDPRLNIQWGVDTVVAAGFPADRIILGAPLYGRGWRGVGHVNHGLWQGSTGGTSGTSDTGVGSYKTLHALLHDPDKDFQRHWDPITLTAWIHSPTEGNGTFWTYEDHGAIEAKIEFIRSMGLMGLMYWDSSGDLPPDHPDAIIPHARRILNHRDAGLE